MAWALAFLDVFHSLSLVDFLSKASFTMSTSFSASKAAKAALTTDAAVRLTEYVLDSVQALQKIDGLLMKT